jgi:hypothetical protein
VNGADSARHGRDAAGLRCGGCGVEIWLPARLDPANRQNRGSHYLDVVGAPAPGVTLEQARAEMRCSCSSGRTRIRARMCRRRTPSDLLTAPQEEDRDRQHGRRCCCCWARSGSCC